MPLFFPLRLGLFPLQRSVLVFLNGKFVPEEQAVISVFDRGFLYGDGLFETIRIFNGKPFRWRDHIERLQAGAEFLKMKVPFSPRRLRTCADELIARNKMPDSLMRISLSRGVGEAGYSPRNAHGPTFLMSLRPAPKAKNPRQWKLITSSVRIAANDLLARFKTSNKLLQILARAEADQAGADEALLLNTDGVVAEGTSSNVFWVKRSAIYTPPLFAGILPGITRAVVFEIAAQLKIPIHGKVIRPKDLGRVDGIFLSLSSWGIVEVGALDGKKSQMSDVTGKVRAAYELRMKGER
jgi:branched-chain amino acid aminotransferase